MVFRGRPVNYDAGASGSTSNILHIERTPSVYLMARLDEISPTAQLGCHYYSSSGGKLTHPEAYVVPILYEALNVVISKCHSKILL